MAALLGCHCHDTGHGAPFCHGLPPSPLRVCLFPSPTRAPLPTTSTPECPAASQPGLPPTFSTPTPTRLAPDLLAGCSPQFGTAALEMELPRGPPKGPTWNAAKTTPEAGGCQHPPTDWKEDPCKRVPAVEAKNEPVHERS